MVYHDHNAQLLSCFPPVGSWEADVKYETATPVGRGGMGDVARAWDPALKRWVALKFLRSNDPELEERMIREARAQARIEHPNVCPVYEVGRHQGRVFIAMQFIDGKPLDQVMPHLGTEQAVTLVRTVAEAIHAAHGAGLIHRDIKPANILVEETPDGLKPWVVDFGIAKERDLPGLSMTGQIVGTPGYLSPEQARGEITTIDRRSDVFSLGVVLYELLSGRNPFGGSNVARNLVNLLEKEPLALRKAAPHVPRDLETIVMKCLEPDRDHRYRSARALAEDLGRFLAGEPVEAQRQNVFERTWRRARRHPRLTAAIVLVIIAGSALIGLTVRTQLTAARRERLAQRFGREVEGAQRTLELAYLRPRHDIRPDIAEVRQRIELIGVESARLGPWAHGIGNAAMGRAFLALDEPDQARSHLEQAWQQGERTPVTASALALALAALYRSALEEAQRIRNPGLRSQKVEKANRELRDPAIAYLTKADPDDEQAGYLKATLTFLSGKDQEALDILARLKKTTPYFYEADLLAGAIHRRRYESATETGDSGEAHEEFEAARQTFHAAVAVARSDPAPYQELCGLWGQALRVRFYSSGEDMASARDAALTACNAALMVNPDSVAAHIGAGRAHRYWADFEYWRGHLPEESLAAGRAHAQEALRLDPHNVDAFTLIGVLHRMAANHLAGSGGDPIPDLEGAVAAYREAIRLEPDNYGALLSLAVAQTSLGTAARSRGEDPSAAFRSAQDASLRATAIQPALVGAWVNLGIARAQLAIWRRDRGEEADTVFDAGAEALDHAVELNPSFITAHCNLGELLLRQAEGRLWRGQDPAPLVLRANKLLETARTAYPSYAAMHYLAAFGHAMVAESSRRTGKDPRAELARARELVASGRAVQANDAEGLAIASFVPLVEARFAMDQHRNPLHAVSSGLEMIDTALAVNSSNEIAWLRKAELLLLAARWKRSRRRPVEGTLDRAEKALEHARSLHAIPLETSLIEASLLLERSRLLAASRPDGARDAAERGLRTIDGVLTLAPGMVEAQQLRQQLRSFLHATMPPRAPRPTSPGAGA